MQHLVEPGRHSGQKPTSSQTSPIHEPVDAGQCGAYSSRPASRLFKRAHHGQAVLRLDGRLLDLTPFRLTQVDGKGVDMVQALVEALDRNPLVQTMLEVVAVLPEDTGSRIGGNPRRAVDTAIGSS